MYVMSQDIFSCLCLVSVSMDACLILAPVLNVHVSCLCIMTDNEARPQIGDDLLCQPMMVKCNQHLMPDNA